MPRTRSIAAVAVAALAAVVSAQSQQPQPQTPFLRGRIIDADNGSPIAGATLRLSGRADITLTTDADGRYQSATLKPGLYDLAASHRGYLTAIPLWGESIPLRLHVDEEGIGPALLQRDWMLERASRINGQILDADGTPIAGADVIAATRLAGASSWPVLQRRGAAITGVDGRFTIDNLAAGAYVIAYRVRENGASRWFFSPGIADPRHATQVEATHREARPPVVMRAATAEMPPAAIRIRSAGGSPLADARVQVSVWSPFPELEEQGAERQVATDSSGIARFEKLPVGRHRILARSPGAANATTSSRGEAWLVLPDQIAAGAELRLRPTIDTCVFTRIDGASAAAADPRTLPVISASIDGGRLDDEERAQQVSIGGTARFRGVAQGATIALRAIGQQPFWALSRYTPSRANAVRGRIPADAGTGGCATAFFRRTTQVITGKVDLPDQEWLPHVDIVATPIGNPAAPLAIGILAPDFSFRISGIADDLRYSVTAVPAGMHDMRVPDANRMMAVGGSTIVVPLSLPVAR